MVGVRAENGCIRFAPNGIEQARPQIGHMGPHTYIVCLRITFPALEVVGRGMLRGVWFEVWFAKRSQNHVRVVVVVIVVVAVEVAVATTIASAVAVAVAVSHTNMFQCVVRGYALGYGSPGGGGSLPPSLNLAHRKRHTNVQIYVYIYIYMLPLEILKLLAKRGQNSKGSSSNSKLNQVESDTKSTGNSKQIQKEARAILNQMESQIHEY